MHTHHRYQWKYLHTTDINVNIYTLWTWSNGGDNQLHLGKDIKTLPKYFVHFMAKDDAKMCP